MNVKTKGPTGKIPGGCKQTSLGILPDDWDVVPLNKICKRISDKNTCGKIKNVLSNSATRGIVRQSDYFNKEIVQDENITSYYVVRDWDFIYNPRISKLAPYGPICTNELNETGIVSPLYTVFRIRDIKDVCHAYLKYYFLSSIWHQYVYTAANFGARFDRMNITNTDFMNLPVIVPAVSEQKKIAEILDHCEGVIELKRSLIKEKLQKRKHIEGQIFRRRNQLKSSGKKWNIVEMREVITKIVGGGTPSRAIQENFVGTIPWATVKDIGSDFYKNDTIEHISAEALLASSAKIIPKNSFIACTRMGIGRGFINKTDMAINQDLKGISISAEMDISFFAFYYRSIKNFERLTNGSTVKGIDLKTFLKIRVPVPPMEEQKAIAQLFSSIDNEIVLLEQDFNLWRKKKKALSQLLLTGIVRVKT